MINYESFLKFMNAGGSVMWVILAMSLIGTAVAAERIIFILCSGRGRTVPDDSELSPEDLHVLAERCVRAEVFSLQRHTAVIGVIVRAAPMLGLLGTVLGMAEMFGALSAAGISNANAVTDGIRTALFTTIAGLCCAIPLFAADGLINSLIDSAEERMNRLWDEAIKRTVERRSGIESLRAEGRK